MSDTTTAARLTDQLATDADRIRDHFADNWGGTHPPVSTRDYHSITVEFRGELPATAHADIVAAVEHDYDVSCDRQRATVTLRPEEARR